jgi:hypothetical protein
MDGEPTLSYSPPSTINEPVHGVSTEHRLEERRLLRKLDIRLVPAIFVIYVMNYVNVSIILAPLLADVTFSWLSGPPLQRRD